MKVDMVLRVIILLIGATVISAGVQADDSNEREVGGWSIELYHGQADDLTGKGVHTNVDQFYNKMGQYGWSKTLRWMDDSAWESDFEDYTRGGDDAYEADSVDLVYFCGHGDSYYIQFGTNHNRISNPYITSIHEVRWGDQDMEWIVLDSCHVLQYKANEQYWWQRWDSTALTIHAGLHVMMGWDSVARYWGFWGDAFESRGGIFADKIHNHCKVWTSWKLATKQAKPWWDWHTDRAAMGYGKIYYSSGQELLRYSDEDFWNPWKDPTWYANHGYTLARGYSSWNV